MNKSIQLVVLLSLLLVLTNTAKICPQFTILIDQKCTPCSDFPHTKQIQDIQISTESCACQDSYTWSHTSKACLSQSQSQFISNSRAQKPSGQNPINSVDFAKTFKLQIQCLVVNSLCQICKAISNSTGLALTTSKCECQDNFRWINQKCTCDYSISLNNLNYYLNGDKCQKCRQIVNVTLARQCFQCQGLFGIFNNSCLNCSAIPFGMRNDITDDRVNGCNCQKGYRFSSITGLCVCDVGFYFNGTSVCQNCSKITDPALALKCNGCTNPFIQDQSSGVCKMGKTIPYFNITSFTCNIGYVFKIDPNDLSMICSCSIAEGYVLNGDVCVSCNENQACLACDNSSLHKSAVECISCQYVQNSTGQATIYGCVCSANYYWNVLTLTCECDWILGFIPSTGGSCFNCSSVANMMLPVYKTQCKCQIGYIYNSKTKICDCDVKGGTSFVSGTKCIICPLIQYSTGLANKSSCNCKSSFIWNTTSLTCQCNTKQSNIDLINGACIDCLSITYSNGFATPFGCACRDGFIWSNYNQMCECPSGSFIHGKQCKLCQTSLPPATTLQGCNICDNSLGFAKSQQNCYYCPFQIKASGQTVNNYCQCKYYLELWTPKYGSCVCYGNYALTDFSDNVGICKRTILQNTCNSSLGLANTFSEYINICSICSTVKNSLPLANGTSCVCISGYKWNTNIYPFACTCSISAGSYLKGQQCLLCSTLSATGKVTKTGCQACSPLQGFLYDRLNDACIMCSYYPYTDGTATSKGCGCRIGIWNPVNFACVPASCSEGLTFNPFLNRCQCDLSVSIYNSKQKCIRCDSLGNTQGFPLTTTNCQCRSNYTWTTQLSSGQGNCVLIPSIVNGNTSPCPPKSFLLGVINGKQACFECSQIAFTTGSTTSSCTCKSIYKWVFNSNLSFGACVCNDSIKIPNTAGSSCVCNPAFSYLKGTACIDCRQIVHSANITDPTNPLSCKCKSNYIWKSIQKICACLPPLVENIELQTCLCLHSFIPNGKGGCECDNKTSILLNGQCLKCSLVPDSTGTISLTKTNSCSCKSNFIFVVEGNSGQCGCGNFMVLSEDKQSCICKVGANCNVNSCNYIDDFILLDGACINCRLIKYSTGKAKESNQCAFPDNYFWQQGLKTGVCRYNHYLRGDECLPCDSLQNQNQVQMCSYVGSPFGNSFLGVVLCSTLPFSTSINNDAECLCLKGYYFNSYQAACMCDFYQGYFYNGSHCIDCEKGDKNLLKSCKSCSMPFLYNNQVCLLAKLIPNFNLTSSTCSKGYQFKRNPFTNTLISCACSATQRFYLNGSMCSPCASIQETQNLKIQHCEGCNNDFGFHKGLIECIYCKKTNFSTGIASKEGCQCFNKRFWNAITTKCQCDPNLNYFQYKENCYLCNKITNAKMINGVCSCIQGYIWNKLTAKCDCNISGGYFGSQSQCLTCMTLPFTSSEVKVNNVCLCKLGSIWNPLETICACDISLNFVISPSGCFNCSLALNSLGIAMLFGCACPPGFVWSFTLYKCHCSFGYYRNGDNCLKCSQYFPPESTLFACQTCDISEQYSSGSDICSYCPSLGASKFVSQQKQPFFQVCSCLNESSQIWNSLLGRCVCYYQQFYFPVQVDGVIVCKKCMPLQDSTSCADCAESNNYFHNLVTNTCDSCVQIFNKSATSYFVNMNCACPISEGLSQYYLSFPSQCSCSHYFGFYLDGSSCIKCNLIQNNQENNCFTCNNSAGFYYYKLNGTCVKCSGVTGASGLANRRGCLCQIGIWNPLSNSCVNITCPVNQQYNAATNSCSCFPFHTTVSEERICYSCSELAHATGRTTYNSQFDRIVCECEKGYIFGLNQLKEFSCICLYPLVSDINGACVCDPIYSITISDKECFLCSDGGALISVSRQRNSSHPTLCQCKQGYQFKWNSQLKQGQCICPTGFKFEDNGEIICVCDLSVSIKIGEQCIACQLIPFSVNRSNSVKTQCGCVIPFIWNSNFKNCSCNSSTVFALEAGIGKCLICSASIFALSKLNHFSCNCNINLFWNSRGFCQCDQISALIIAGTRYSCLQCIKANYATNKFNRTVCMCLPSFIWAAGKCACPAKAFIATVDNLPKCIVCNASIFANAVKGTNACTCVSSIFIWNSVLNSCVCSNSSSIAFKNGTALQCVVCAEPINAASRATEFTCNCVNNTYVWVPELGKCGCADSTSVLVNGSKCIVCNSSIFASSKFNATVCNCAANFLSWKPVGQCECSVASAALRNPIQFGIYSCVVCNSSNLALSRLNATACKCKTGFVWNGVNCVCPALNVYTTALQCLNCNIASNQKLDDYLCLCVSPNFWDDIKKSCITCGSTVVSKSTAQNFGRGIGCVCQNEYIWDVMTNTCILGCTSNTAACMNCNKILNTATKIATVGNNSKYRQLSGSQAIGAAYLAAATNYASLSTYACNCAVGFSWDPYRKRCYNSLTP